MKPPIKEAPELRVVMVVVAVVLLLNVALEAVPPVAASTPFAKIFCCR